MAMGTWPLDYLITMGIQWAGIKLMAVGIQCLNDNPGIETAYLYQQKMTKMQRMHSDLMAVGTQ